MPWPWMIDELAYAGAEHLDPEFVAGYDRKQQFDPTDDATILRGIGLGMDATLVDLGAGTGTFALAAAREVRRVIAVDVSAVMLDRLRARADGLGVTNIEYVQAGFLSFESPGSTVDAVYTRNALHQLPDFWKGIALSRIGSLLGPGGTLLVRDLVYDFTPAEADAVLERWLGGAALDPASGYTREDFIEHIRTEHSTYRVLFEAILDATGFDIVDAQFRRSIYGAYTCVKR